VPPDFNENIHATWKLKIVTPWKINGWNRIIEVGKIIFLSKWVVSSRV